MPQHRAYNAGFAVNPDRLPVSEGNPDLGFATHAGQLTSARARRNIRNDE